MKILWNLFLIAFTISAFYGAWIHNWFILGGFIIFNAIKIAFEIGMEIKK